MLSVLRVILVVPLDSNSVEHERLWNTLSTVSLMNLYKYKGLGLDGLSNVGRVGKMTKVGKSRNLYSFQRQARVSRQTHGSLRLVRKVACHICGSTWQFCER